MEVEKDKQREIESIILKIERKLNTIFLKGSKITENDYIKLLNLLDEYEADRVETIHGLEGEIKRKDGVINVLMSLLKKLKSV